MTEYSKCSAAANGKHEADPRSAQQADETDFVVDFSCKRCGQSGSVAVDPTDIDWG